MDSTESVRHVAWWRLAVLVACAGVVIAFLVIGVHVLNVHRGYGVWAWSPPARTASIEYHGRHYLRTVPGTERDLADCVRVGTAPGDGQIFTRPTTLAGTASVALYIRYPDGSILVYALSGGP